MTIENENLESLIGKAPAEEEKKDAEILRIAVVGAGTMGQGIAQTASQAGLDVLIVERDEDALKSSLDGIEDKLDWEISRWAKTVSDKKAVMSRIRGTLELAEVAEYPVVIEALPENLAIKKVMFGMLDETTQPETIFVTNTSTLSITEIATATRRPDKVIGMHFLYPVPKTPVVEVVRGLKTSGPTFERIRRFAVQLGKTPIEVYEYPGYVTTRIILPMINEAMYVLMEGVATAEGIDTALKLGYNMDMGPLQLADQMGLDEVMAWMESLFRELGDLKYRPCPLLRKMVRAGHLGKKSGQGFFQYDDSGRIIRQGRAE
ncbi:MAG: 3-hydroxybutyryl-CoA dehydrogenase [Candidatus Zixiibacteriota bacterium]|nr:MAG: 3-hydroxybutyryl-CoA dehydrogenase [candidate division Zixibacteria bacterium]